MCLSHGAEFSAPLDLPILEFVQRDHSGAWGWQAEAGCPVSAPVTFFLSRLRAHREA